QSAAGPSSREARATLEALDEGDDGGRATVRGKCDATLPIDDIRQCRMHDLARGHVPTARHFPGIERALHVFDGPTEHERVRWRKSPRAGHLRQARRRVAPGIERQDQYDGPFP